MSNTDMYKKHSACRSVENTAFMANYQPWFLHHLMLQMHLHLHRHEYFFWWLNSMLYQAVAEKRRRPYVCPSKADVASQCLDYKGFSASSQPFSLHIAIHTECLNLSLLPKALRLEPDFLHAMWMQYKRALRGQVTKLMAWEASTCKYPPFQLKIFLP